MKKIYKLETYKKQILSINKKIKNSFWRKVKRKVTQMKNMCLGFLKLNKKDKYN